MLFRLNRLIPWSFPAVLIAAYAWSAIAATAATQTPVGEVENVQGRGWGVTPWGKTYDKLGGDLVDMDEVVATGFNSAMTMRFIDNTTMTLGPRAQITIDDMVYNPDDGEHDAVVFKLGKGSFYFVSGMVAKEKVILITPTATIGIRGTELVIDVDEDGSTSVGVAKGHAFMRSNRDGRSVEVEVGNTARTDKKGKVSDPFPGIDLTGEEDVDRKIPGVAEWLDEDGEEDDQEDLTEFASGMPENNHENNPANDHEYDDESGDDGQDQAEGDDGPDSDEIASREDSGVDGADGEVGDDGDNGGKGREGGDDGDGADNGDHDGGDHEGGEKDGGDHDKKSAKDDD